MAKRIGDKMSTAQAMDIINTHAQAAAALLGVECTPEFRERVIEQAWEGNIEGIGPVRNGEGTILGEALRAIY